MELKRSFFLDPPPNNTKSFPLECKFKEALDRSWGICPVANTYLHSRFRVSKTQISLKYVLSNVKKCNTLKATKDNEFVQDCTAGLTPSFGGCIG